MRKYNQTDMSAADAGMLVVRNYNGNVVRPKWSGINTYRLTGPATPDLKNIVPWRDGPEENNFGLFFAAVPIFRGGTTRNVTFVSALRNPDDPSDYLDLKMTPSPIMTLHSRLKGLSYKDPILRDKLFTGGKNKAAAFSNPALVHGLLQGVTLVKKEGNVVVPSFPNVIILPASARTAFAKLLNEENPGYSGDPNDYGARFACGNITDPNNGKLLHIYNAEENSDDQEERVDWNASTANKSATQSVKSYSCKLGKTFPLPRTKDGRLAMAVENKLFTSWDEIINFMDEKEMLEVICSAFSDIPDLIRMSFSDRLDLLPKTIAAAQRIVDMGANRTPVAKTVATPTHETLRVDEPEEDDQELPMEWGNAMVFEAPEAKPADEPGEDVKAAVAEATPQVKAALDAINAAAAKKKRAT